MVSIHLCEIHVIFICKGALGNSSSFCERIVVTFAIVIAISISADFPIFIQFQFRPISESENLPELKNFFLNQEACYLNSRTSPIAKISPDSSLLLYTVRKTNKHFRPGLTCLWSTFFDLSCHQRS